MRGASRSLWSGDMKCRVLSLIAIVGALAATDASAQGYVDQYGREYRPPVEAAPPSRLERDEARPSRRGPLDARAQGRGARSVAAFDGRWSVAIITERGACD